MSAVVLSSTSEYMVENSNCRLRNIGGSRTSTFPVSGTSSSSNNHNNNRNNNRNNNNCNNNSLAGNLVEDEESANRRNLGGSGSDSNNTVATTGGSSSLNRIVVSPTNNNNTQSVKQCCFHWCCCCPCSCLTVKGAAQEEMKEGSPKHDIMKLFAEDNIPTLEEIEIWGESFDRLMKNDGGQKVFREFLRGEYSEENILFWLACEELKKETNASIVEERARFIYEDYISILSPKEVSLDSRVREIVNKNMIEPKADMFDEAQTQIYTLMHRDSYPRFVNSQLYKDLLSSATKEVASTSACSAKKSRSSSATRKKNGS